METFLLYMVNLRKKGKRDYKRSSSSLLKGKADVLTPGEKSSKSSSSSTVSSTKSKGNKPSLFISSTHQINQQKHNNKLNFHVMPRELLISPIKQSKYFYLMGQRKWWKQDVLEEQEGQCGSYCRLECSDLEAPQTTPYHKTWTLTN